MSLVSVVMVVYNQQLFIKQAIESVLYQKTTFNFHIYIGEDCSTDNSRNILLYYKKKYPDRIKLLLNDNNIGMHKNVFKTFNEVDSKYIAFLEGDDYYSKDNHLQTLFDAFEQNQTSGFVASTYSHIDSNKKITRHNSKKKELKILDAFLTRPFHISSCLFNGADIKSLLKFVKTKNNFDYILDKNFFIACAKNKSIFLLNNNSMMYRYMQGVTSLKNKDLQKTIKKNELHLDLIQHFNIKGKVKLFIETNLLLLKARDYSLIYRIKTIKTIMFSENFLFYPNKKHLIKQIFKLL